MLKLRSYLFGLTPLLAVIRYIRGKAICLRIAIPKIIREMMSEDKLHTRKVMMSPSRMLAGKIRLEYRCGRVL